MGEGVKGRREMARGVSREGVKRGWQEEERVKVVEVEGSKRQGREEIP